MERIIELIGKAIEREMKGRADTQSTLFDILKDIARKLEELEKRIKAIEERPWSAGGPPFA